MKDYSNFLFLLFLFILLNKSKTDPLDLRFKIPESSFISLKSRELSKFELTKAISEVYYSFENDFDGSDIIMNFKIAKGFTTNCYIYDSYDKIQINSQGEYINYLKEFSLTDNFIIFKNSQYIIRKIKYYIIIKDIINSYYKDYISIFNEQDKIILQNEKYLTLEKFYSKNFYTLSFSHTKNEIVELEININNVNFYQNIQIFSKKLQSIIYAGEINRGVIKINEDMENEDEYTIEITSEEEPYIDIQSSIILHKYEKSVKKLEYNEPLTLSFTGNKIFNFYVDIDDYDYNDENIITFKFGNQVFNRKLLSHCYGKIMNFEVNDDNKFLANMPANEEDNEAVFERINGAIDIYQLYFKKRLKKEENKKTYLLIHLSIKIEAHDTNEYIPPNEFVIYLSNKPKKIKLEEYKNNNIILNENIKLKSYIPQIYKVLFPKNEENLIKLSYIFYTSENIQIIYNNTMLNIDNHIYEKSKNIYAISSNNEGYDYINAIYIKLYGFTNNEVNFRIESTEFLIYYIQNDYRKIRTFNGKLTDCNKPLYYIGDYGDFVENGYLYQETLYGKINTYYKSQINPSDKTILINDEPKYLIENNLFSLNTSIDIVELKCEIPGFYQVHLMDDVGKREINLYSRIYNYLSSGNNFTIYPILSPIQEDINFEIYTPEGKEILISDGAKITKIDSNNKYYQKKYKNISDIPECFTVLSNEETVISITLTNPDPFILIDKDSAHVDYDSQIIIKLKQNKQYESLNIIITRIYHGYSYSLFKGNVEYASKLIESEYDYNNIDRAHKINMTISNPYLRDDNIDNENNVYYLIYSIDDPEKIQKDVFLTYNEIKEYEKIDINKSKVIFNNNEKYSIPFQQNLKFVNMVYQSCGNSLKEIDIYNYNDKIRTIINTEIEPIYQKYKINKEFESNFQVSIDFKDTSKDNFSILKGAVIGFSDQDITDEDIKKYSDMKLNISQNGQKIEWEKIENKNKYDIFVFDENSIYIPYLKNPCLLQSIKINQTVLINNNESYIKYYSSNDNYIILKEEGKYIVVVSIDIEGKVPLVYIYDKIIYDSSLVPPDDKGDDDKDNDDKKRKGTIIFLAIALPLVTIVVLILLIVLIKSKKKPAIELEEPKEPLVRDTMLTNNA